MYVPNRFLSRPDHFGPLEPRSPVASKSYRAHAGMRNVCPICPYLSLVTAVAFFALTIVVLAVL
jgi:hypothetical protein